MALDGILQLPPAFLPTMGGAGCFVIHGRCLLPQVR
jgi:hypothetical protein